MNKRLEAVVADIVEGVRGALTKHGGVRVIETTFSSRLPSSRMRLRQPVEDCRCATV
jgi:hypothetical protein